MIPETLKTAPWKMPKRFQLEESEKRNSRPNLRSAGERLFRGKYNYVLYPSQAIAHPVILLKCAVNCADFADNAG